MTHVIVGYPSLEKTVEIVKAMEEAGADFIELQIPFSDPLADGPTIMKACELSLENGTTVKDAFTIARQLTKEVKVQLLFMAYFNTVFKYGVEKFCKDAASIGMYGLIVPDMPIEEEQTERFTEYCKKYGLVSVRVLSPVSTSERMKANAKIASGFVYCTARQGITGAQKGLDPKIVKYLKEVKKHIKIPVAVGFGISKKEYVDMIRPYADIAVVGSAIIDVINNSKHQDVRKNVTNFIRGLGV